MLNSWAFENLDLQNCKCWTGTKRLKEGVADRHFSPPKILSIFFIKKKSLFYQATF